MTPQVTPDPASSPQFSHEASVIIENRPLPLCLQSVSPPNSRHTEAMDTIKSLFYDSKLLGTLLHAIDNWNRISLYFQVTVQYSLVRL